MKFKIVKIFFVLLFCDLISCKGFFTIVGPKLLRFQEKYQVSITAQGYNEGQKMEISLRNLKVPSGTFAKKQVELTNGTQLIDFDLKDQQAGECVLEAKSLSGEKFEKIAKLDMNVKKHSVFVQTDKSIYKPADKVQFRVLVLDADMKPLKKSKVEAYITDGAQNRVKQFEDISLTKGVFQNELQLSDSPVLGSWMIHVKLNGEEITAKEFEVAEYVLPKFEVSIDANPDANFKDGKIRATVKAKYTFGKIAKGNATVTAKVEKYCYWRCNEDDNRYESKISKSVSVDGKKPVEFDIEEDLKIKYKFSEKTVKLFATFTEELTGKEQNATATVTIHITPHKIELKKSSDKFKPGLPFKVTAIVKAHDKDAPISDSWNPLVFTVKHYYDVMRTCERYKYRYDHYDSDYSQPYFGHSSFGFPSSPFGSSSSSSYGQLSSPFGQPSSSFGQPSSSFGQPSSSFGQPSSSFGQPSSSFGQPSSSFGQPSSSFGQPSSPFGSSSSSPFGSYSSSSFGQPSSSFGQPSSSFGQPSSPFGSSSSSPFGSYSSSYFGQPSSPFGQQSSPFGQPFGLPPRPRPTIETYECRDEKSFEEKKEIFLSNGFAELDIELKGNTIRIDVTAKYLDTQKEASASKAETESGQYIKAKLVTEKPKLSQNVKIEVLSTHDLSQLTLQIVAKGEVVVSKVVDGQNKKQHQIEFIPTLSMVPTANVIVYYITKDGEIISDSLKVEFGNELRNFIDIELSKDQAKPGEQLDISIYSKPNSFVGLLGVDQSVLVMKKGNDIEQSTVFAELGRYSKVDKHNYEYVSGYDYNTLKDFSSSDAVVITNAKKEYSAPYIPRYHSPIHNQYYPADRITSGHGFNGLFMAGPSASASSASAASSAGGGFGESGFGFGASQGGVGLIAGGSDRGFDSPFRISNYDPLPEMSRDVSEERKSVKKVDPPSFEIRKTFPETFLFDTFDFNSTTSNASLSKKVPDTITSWIITGFSIDLVTGLGLTRQPSKFTVFQPFFVSTNLPYSIKRGEVVSIPIVVFNYLDSDQEAEVTFFNSDGEFEFADVKEDGSPARRKRALETQRKKKVLVKSQSGTSVPFMIRPLKVGHITIKVVATSNVAGDGVERQLIVEPEGVTQYMNKAVFIDLRNNPEFKSNISITIPKNAVPDSTKIEASAIGDILGPSIENLDKLIKLPYGCGEQNMLNFVPNIVVLDYLTTLNKLTPEIESKAKKYMESGYQRELTYKHEDGSYSAFGKSDKSGSTWLTAFVAKSFRQAAKYILVDEEIIKQALEFLSKVQTSSGSFPEVGHVSHKDMQGGSANGIALTAYTLITFLENQDENKTYQSTIDKALDYIVNHFDTLEDNYSLAIASYALQLAKQSSKDSFLAKLETKSENKNGMMYWEKPVAKADEDNPWSYRPNAVNVEMSAYALQAFVEAGRDTDSVPIMKWLVTQRNENGGFQSTQDTVVGLQALSKLATKIYVPNSKIDMTIKHSGDSTTNLKVNEKNALILQKHELPATATDFEVTAKGRGFSILQISYKYNLRNEGEWPRFTLEPVVNKDSNKDFLHLTVCTSFVADATTDKSNMAVMELAFPSGYTFDTDTLPELKASENVKKIETKEGETIVVVYFDDVGTKKLCPEFKAYRTHSVALQKPAPVIVYDYYDSSRRARSFYNPPEISLCDICNGAEECKQDCEQSEINVV